MNVSRIVLSRIVRGWSAHSLLQTLLLVAAVGGVQAQTGELVSHGGLSRAQFDHQAQALASADAEARKAAFAALGKFSHSSLTGATQHFESLLLARPSHDDALRVLTAFRRAAGSKRADDDTDLSLGVLRVLETERSQAVLVMAQSLLFLRGLETLNDPDTYLAIAFFVDLDQGAWDNELRLLRSRKGLALLPALIRLRSHETAGVRRFAQASVTQLGMDDPAAALATPDPYLVANIVRAYGNPTDYAAMPLIVRLVNDSRMQVRQAARAALDRYGKNAIWQVRALYEEVSSRPANKAWSFEQSRDELYAVLDRQTEEDAQTLLARGLASFVGGKLDAMQQDFDTLLATHPDFADKAKMAPGYAAVGGDRLAADDLQGSADAYRRALRLSPSAPEAKQWQAKLAYVSAEQALSEGIVDLTAYDQALALDPTLTAARKARDTLSGEQARRKHAEKRYAALAALAMMLVLAFLTLRPRKPPLAQPAGNAAE